MPTYPAYKLKPYYDALKTWLLESHNEDGTLKSSAVQAEVAAAIAAEPTVVQAAADAAAAAVDAEPRVASLMPGAGKIVTGNPDGDPVAVGFGGGFLPLRNVTLTERTGAQVIPIDAIGGTLFGRGTSTNTNTLYRSTDDGQTWTALGAVGSGAALAAVRQLGDREVIISNTASLLRSTGWATDPATATWTVVVTPTPATTVPGAAIIPFNLDVSDQYVLAGEYVAPDRTNARKLRFSQDYGQTFTDLLDLNAMYPGWETETHWHGVCIDRWADTPSGVRLWASHGDGPRALMYSDDLGANWTTLSTDWQFTTLSATPAGIVCVTDETPDGVYRVLRTPDPADMVIEPMHLIDRGGGYGALYGFSSRSFYHEQTGLVYVSFLVNTQAGHETPALVLASDGYTADEVWASPWTGDVMCQNVCVVDGGSVHWVTGEATFHHAQADQVVRGGKSPYQIAQGGQLAGTAADKGSIGIGANVVAASASTVIGVDAVSTHATGENTVVGHAAVADISAYQAVVLGKSATAQGHHTAAIGHGAVAMYEGATAIGKNTKAYLNAVAIGVNAKSGEDATTKGQNGIAIGSGALNEASNGGVAIGYNSRMDPLAAGAIAVGEGARGNNYGSTALGGGAYANGNQTIAIGVNTHAKSTGAMAIGGECSSTWQDSISLGRGVTTTFLNQVALGAKHIEMAETSDPGAPAANKGRLYFRDNGSGKTQLVVQFPTGAVQVIATEP